jgi:hypothetical protein
MSKQPLIQKLRRRLLDVKAPPAAVSQQALEMVAQGKLLLVCVKLDRPCSCDMCNGRHEGVVCLVSPSTKIDLEQLFAA